MLVIYLIIPPGYQAGGYDDDGDGSHRIEDMEILNP
jgi:hypothetical protein